MLTTALNIPLNCCQENVYRLHTWSCLRGLNSLKRRVLQLDEADLIIDEKYGHETMELLVLCGAH